MYLNQTKKILSTLIGLMAALFLVRSNILYYYLFDTPGYFSKLIAMLCGSFYDWGLVLSIGGVALGCSYLFKNNLKALSKINLSFTILSVLILLLAVLNIKAVRMLGGPFNYQWLYYSDFLEAADGRKAILENLSWKLLGICLALVFGMFFIKFSLQFILNQFQIFKRYSRLFLSGASLILVFYLIGAWAFISNTKLGYKEMANPIVAFTESLKVAYETENDLFSTKLPDDFEEFPGKMVRYESSFQHSPKNKIKNVILYVLESVPAEYVSGYSKSYDVTPQIKRYLEHSSLFSDIYAHIPSTNNAMVSLLGSIYPMISYKSITAEYPELKWPTLSSELKQNGFRTAFFHASDNRFQRVDEFLSVRNFDRIADYRDIPCDGEVYIGSNAEWKNLDGIDEGCMVDNFIDWQNENSGQEPFFATLWTMQTHYPYFTPTLDENLAPENPELNRYLNALKHSDKMLGKLLDHLKTTGLFESTLVIVTGDHGEAFGRHNQRGHGVYIYEENVRIPLIFINPKLFDGQKVTAIGGQVDIAPTIMDILNLTPPKDWQGLSLFNPSRSNRAYFFNPYSDFLFGIRIDDYKLIYNIKANQTMVFNVRKDPEETVNLASSMPEFVDLNQKRLARWVQYQKEVIKEVIQRE